MKDARVSGGGRLRHLPWRPVAAAAGVGLAVAVTVSLASRRETPAAVSRTTAVSPPRTLVEVGELRSSSVTPVYVRVSGEIAWLVDEGAIVGPDDVVARLDDSEDRARFEEKERETVPLRSDVEQHEQEVESARALGPLKVRLAEIKLALAEWGLQELKRHPTPEELASARLDLRVAQLRGEKTAGELARTREAAERGLATDIELRQRVLAALDAEAEAELARLRLDVLLAGPDTISLESKRLDVEKARLTVERVRFESDADTVIAEKSLETAKAYLARGERELEQERADLAFYTVKAGAPGRVSFPELRKYTKDLSRVQVGESVHHDHQLCEVVDPSQMEARIFVNEVDALSLRTGLPATVRMAALPGVEIPGEIASIGFNAADKNEKLGRLALEKAGRAGVGVVEVKVALDRDAKIVDPDGELVDLGSLRGGHTVTVEIDIDGPRGAEGTPPAGAAEAEADGAAGEKAGEKPDA